MRVQRSAGLAAADSKLTVHARQVLVRKDGEAACAGNVVGAGLVAILVGRRQGRRRHLELAARVGVEGRELVVVELLDGAERAFRGSAPGVRVRGGIRRPRRGERRTELVTLSQW